MIFIFIFIKSLANILARDGVEHGVIPHVIPLVDGPHQHFLRQGVRHRARKPLELVKLKIEGVSLRLALLLRERGAALQSTSRPHEKYSQQMGD